MKFATKPIRQYPPHLRHVATLPWKIKNQVLCTYSADMEENANKLYLCTDFNSSTCVTVYAECIYVLTEYLICRCLATCQLCLCPATFSTAYEHHASSSFSQEIRLSTTLLCTPSNKNLLSKSCPRRWIPCWLLTNTAVFVMNFQCHKLTIKVYKKKKWHKKFYLQSVEGKTCYFKHQKYQNLKMNNKVTGD